MLNIYILTLFPEFFESPFSVSIIKRAIDRNLVKIELINIRDFSHDKHKKVDDYPYGGGCGMVMKPEPIFESVEYVEKKIESTNRRIILLSPQGKIFNQAIAQELSCEQNLVFICGHYEGIDERVKTIITDEISLGDFILTGGEIPALAVTDSVIRLVPGVLGSSDSPVNESFCNNLLEYPQYTRPEIYRGLKVPDVLLSGDHKKIEIYRRKAALIRTKEKRPDLFEKIELTEEDRKLLE
ncbi:tRNA (guanine-N(1)-)-methyltransferase [Tepidanaerobacter syntrophicus]|uniref:tRNA (guanine-N(1)-)-methyltransferase n=2 Tax=Tepidanaerobacter TaxID=499228 RepID=A0A0U9HHI4_9FIRM|nr:tRNA (guanosine(37)-N1)-methyltransferase TrmD [Tepidanaerobacter syntrophicus]GAQ26277.1 tRNA (guanine37-N1)-methyltransferase [Tepidanaerobacter syntrophicus]GLI50101.1 tRNA (guanine-N(1)-)-methyltransferase [Tepidanaerobacter syntrophicus]HHV83509.1 tRNA (guanosine(37)-N1)-methyltransferase TrmD [Tepidanaerobacter syntrophicus]